MKRSLTISAAAAAVVMWLAAPAAAAPAVFVERWTQHDEFLAHERWDTPDEEWCPQVEFPVRVEEDRSGMVRLHTRGSSPHDGASTFRREGTFTNLDNGQTFSFTTRGMDKDARVRELGGGVLSIEGQTTARTSYRGPDGKRLFRDAEQLSFTVEINAEGTPSDEDDDVKVDFELGGTDENGQTTGRNLCEDLVGFIG
ncbi:hypothetical protein L1785_16085 [Antribacter sp. KLBMP9083]|uniref:Uncharacterized protein n=1 Tax=Antribacter soli TaxID=2910976 RepID=A0AA41QG54_9MICO|nr:hypothetical protein [Antribacter soli]MCF4122498.1 hypothetical protein [Antribacter soli]